MQDGHSNVYICNLLQLDVCKYMNIVSKIRHRKSWKNISCNYTWDTSTMYKKYSKDDIYLMCIYIHKENKSIKNILDMFPQYSDEIKLRNVLKKIKQRKLYKSIILQVECSTTRERVSM